MPKLVLYYFNFPFWRAEVSRLALHLGEVIAFKFIKETQLTYSFDTFSNRLTVIRCLEMQVEFEDKRVDFKFIKECGKSPFGQAPFLEVDGKVISQTGAIARYCGKLGGFYPKDDDFAAAKIDEIIDTATDITNLIGPTMRMGDAEKLEARKVLASDKLPMYFSALEAMMKANGSTGFFVGDKMTIADIAMWRLMGWFKGGALDGISTDMLDKYPLLTKSFNDTESHPKIKAWMDSHYPKK